MKKTLSTYRMVTLLFCFAAQCANAQTFLTAGLVSFYPFDGNANDFSGTGHNGIIEGAVLTSDRFHTPDHAFNFGPSTATRITVEDSAALNFPAGFTVSCWVKYNQSWAYHSEAVVSQFKYPENVGWTISVNQDDSAYGHDLYAVIFQGDSKQATNLVSFDELKTWHQYVGVFDGASLKLYSNGNLVGTTPLNAITKASTSLLIGGSLNPVSGAYDRDIDNVRIYNRALTDAEVKSLFLFESTPPLQIEVASIRLKWFGELGANFQIEESSDFQTWTAIKTVAGTGDIMTFVDETPDPDKFYRLVKN